MKDQAPWGQFSSPCLLGVDWKYSRMSLAGKTLKSGEIVIDNVSLNLTTAKCLDFAVLVSLYFKYHLV